MGEILKAVIAMMRIEKNLYIFYEKRKRDTKNRVTNTDGNLVPVTINKVILYRNLEEVRLFYEIGH
jgi:hypothetical protein